MRSTTTSRVLIGAAMGLSGFLSFQVQPIMAKFILPWFGGSATTWTVCMLFFQMSLLLGYALAFASTRWLSPRGQAGLQIVLLVLAVAFLPITPDDALKPADSDNPVGRILWVLVTSVGIPYAVLSTTSPLLQRWLASLEASGNVSRYFAISNLGSFLGLLSYPFVFERLLSSSEQTVLWSAGFVLCALLYASVAAIVWREAAGPGPATTEAGIAVRGADVGLWIGLSALGSVLLLAITNQITQWTAVVPFLWIMPLSLYLLTFVAAFGSQSFYRRLPFLALFAVAAAVSFQLARPESSADLVVQLGLQGIVLFLGCMICHGELVALKPRDTQLPAFYLAISVGGALGGLLVTFLAPVLFSDYREHPITIALIGVAAVLLHWREDGGAGQAGRRWVAVGSLAVLIGGLAVWAAAEIAHGPQLVERIRNFYGVVKVVREDEDDPEEFSFVMQQAGVDQGSQFQAAEKRRVPACAFGAGSGIDIALAYERKRREGKPLRLGIIGLGAGMIASHGKPGDTIRYYELNPAVTDLARRRFTFLSDSAAAIEVVHGDGRILMERELDAGQSGRFDILVIDAFRGASPPMHLMTKEAFDLYLRHLAPDGILAINFELDTFEMAPLHRGLAKAFGLQVGWFETLAEGDCEDPVSWALYSRDPAFFRAAEVAPRISAWRDGGRAELLWTDRSSNLMSIINWQ
ncbi:fused MFS/spermidine synthase [Alsobacter sp. R-9]